MNIVARLSTHYDGKPVIRSLLQLVPGWGAADTLLQTRANEIRNERLKVFFDELAGGKHELTDELVQTEDFLHSYFCTLRAVLNTRQREKIKLLAQLLDSSLTPSIDSTTDEFEELLAVLEAVSLREFLVLKDLRGFELQHHPTGEETDLQIATKYWDQFKDMALEKYDIPNEGFAAFMAKLERTGLYLRITGMYYDYEGNVGRTTPLFARLLEFVSNSSAQSSAAAGG